MDRKFKHAKHLTGNKSSIIEIMIVNICKLYPAFQTYYSTSQHICNTISSQFL